MQNVKENKTDFWDIISVLLKWRRLLVVNFLGAVILTFLIALFLPKWYLSSAAIFPPEEESTGMGLASSLLGGGLGSMLSGSGMSLPSFASLSDVYAAILKSRVVAEGVVVENDLQDVYDLGSMEKTLAVLAGHTIVEITPEGIINIAVEDKEPEFARQLVLSYLEGLDRINTTVRASRASATRKFVEERLDQTKLDLENAENEFREFQINNKTISLQDQVRAAIENLALLNSELVSAEIELGVIKQSLLPTHMKVKQQQAKIAEIKRQIEKMERGTVGSENDSSLVIPIFDTPDLSMELLRLTRNLKIQEAIFELLTQQYEQAKIQETKDTPTIQVLDPPKVPEFKSRPKRLTMAVVAGVLCVFLSIIVVFVIEFIDRNKKAETETYRRLEDILNVIKDDFYLVRTLFSRQAKGDSNSGG
jgi:uncharacterized protein involved in exopolysaccharide biosynthesis